jgi:hypothetical protein
VGVFDAFATASAKTKIAAISFVLAKMFFLLTIASVFISISVAIINLIIYAGLVATSIALCIMDMLEKNKNKQIIP